MDPSPLDDAVLDAIDTAFDILDLLHLNPPGAPDSTRTMLLDLIGKHGSGALAGVWMIWGRSIALGLHEAQKPPAALYPDFDCKPDLYYARNVVVIANQTDPEGMAAMVDAVWRDQDSRRTGASIEGTSAVLAMAALQYGKPSTKTDWLPRETQRK